MNEVVVVSARRTATGAFMGGLSGLSAVALGSHVIRALLEESGVKASEISQVIMGQVLTAGCGQNPARQSALKAGLPVETQCMTINKVCGSGLKSIHLGMQALLAGEATFVIAGGQESMSSAPHILTSSRTGTRLGNSEMKDSLVSDGLWDAFDDIHMGVTAENVADKFGITREMQDEFALLSHMKAIRAQEQDVFEREIVPVEWQNRKGETQRVDTDEGPRQTSIEKLEKLKPVFRKGGTVTAGNASSLNDGAAAVLLCTRCTAEAQGLPVLASLGEFTNSGIKPALMGAGPIQAITDCLTRSGWKPEDIEHLESNEAFAAQALAVIAQTGISPERINPYGGAIALGHAIGSSGCRILVTLVHGLIRTNGQRGMAALCIGGGEGVALSVYRQKS
ncbi:acetyl-CoA C-acetyltransferase [Erwinia tasmaniensis]|uniref:Acetyl-CoA acetyltransferase n=1 Tax=Erwinia tasmaniensis (strain DSM 17950 / CFBP 7177 / CIP 109463 / NCPPB 4357 / Et1/99) TaxID=465817 RepID=B2VBH8_ERWT9|nr:acetyl-CoA C-acetyltransferase [Erwinia tasmaniensis]CAO97451.1 Acetyl-CoA acetyltransferase [Erwinia tasmaniensis Et1/99]